MRRTILALVALAACLTLAAPADARDTTWGCPTCVTVHP